jgi:hypothetical protein
VQAFRGVECATLGSDAQSKVTLEVGIDAELGKLYAELWPEIEKRHKHVQRVRTTIAPLMQNAKRLTVEQKERATELLFDAETTEAEANEMLDRLKARYARLVSEGRWDVVVTGRLCPGVTIRFPGIETTTRMLMKGPVTISGNWQSARPTITCRLADGKVGALESRPTQDENLLRLRAALQRLEKPAAGTGGRVSSN